MPVVNTYVPSDTKITLAANYVVGGIVSMSIEFPRERFKTIPGIKGQHARVGIEDTSCVLTLELLQTTTANDVLSDILSQDLLTGRGRLEINIQDNSGTSNISSTNAFINNFPQARYSGELATRTWTITMLNTETIFVGGNNRFKPSLIEQAATFVGGLF
jgi:hypothetical protein